MKKILKWGLIVIIGLGVIGSLVGGDNEGQDATEAVAPTTQENETASNEAAPTKPIEEEKVQEDIPTEYKSALKKAEMYDSMSMSKAGLYEQLTSEYGEKFTKEAAQYAIDNVQSDWKEHALKKAKTYQEDMAMSPSAIYDQLVSEHGEKFTKEEAQYAVDNL